MVGFLWQVKDRIGDRTAGQGNSGPHACVTTFLSSCLNNLHCQGCVGVVISGEMDVMLLSMQIQRDAPLSRRECCGARMLTKDESMLWAWKSQGETGLPVCEAC